MVLLHVGPVLLKSIILITLKRFINRINKVYDFSAKYLKGDILLKKKTPFTSDLNVCIAAITLVIFWHGFCDVSITCNISIRL